MGFQGFISALPLPQGAPAGGGNMSMLPLLIIGAGLIGFMMWSNRRRQKQAQSFRTSLKAGQKVRLYAGMMGTIVSIGEAEAFVEIAPGVVVTIVPQAIQSVVEDDTAATDPEIDSDVDIDSITGPTDAHPDLDSDENR